MFNFFSAYRNGITSLYAEKLIIQKMILNKNFKISKYGNIVHLVNINSGEVYKINEVTETIIRLIEEQRDLDYIIKITFEKFRDEDDSFSKEDLRQFILRLQTEGIIQT